jgi:hypothetical protein
MGRNLLARGMGDAPQQLWGFMAPIAAGAAVALGGLWANRRLGLNPAKDSLIVLLQGRVKVLEDDNRDLEDRISYLENVLEDHGIVVKARRRHDR